MNYETLSRLENQVWLLRKIAPYDDELEKLKSKIDKIRDKFVKRLNEVSNNNDYELELLRKEALEIEQIFYMTFNYRKSIVNNNKSLLYDLNLNEVTLEPFDYKLTKTQIKQEELFDLKKDSTVQTPNDNFNNNYSMDARKWIDDFNKKLSKINQMEKIDVIVLIEELRKFEASMYREEYYLEEFTDEINHIRQILNSRLTIQNPKQENTKDEVKKRNFEDEDSFIKEFSSFTLKEEPKIEHRAYNVSQDIYSTPQVDGFYERLRKK